MGQQLVDSEINYKKAEYEKSENTSKGYGRKCQAGVVIGVAGDITTSTHKFCLSANLPLYQLQSVRDFFPAGNICDDLRDTSKNQILATVYVPFEIFYRPYFNSSCIV